MVDEEHILKIKCPHCGWVRRWKIRVVDGKAEMVIGGMNLSNELKDITQKIQALWTDPSVTEANAWINIPTCPNCAKSYQYNLRSGASK